MPDALLVSSSFLPGRGGIESYLAELCLRLSPSLSVLAPARRGDATLPADLPYPAAGFEGSMLVPSGRVARAIVDEAQRQGVERVLLGTPWPLALLGPRLRRAGLKYAVIAHGAELLVPGAVPLLRTRFARALSQADLLLAVSDYTAHQLRALIEERGLAAPPIDLLRARVDLERFRPDVDTSGVRERYGLAESDRVVLCFGRLVPRKGVHRLIEAFPVLAERVPEALLLVAGTGPEERRLHRLAHREGVRAIFTGRVPEADAPAVYAAAEVFCLPVADRWFGLEVEGLGVVLLEAAACGVPCVTGRSGGTPEAVIEGVSGHVVDATDRVALVDAVARLLEDPLLAEQMGRSGRAHIQAEFSERPAPRILLDWLGRDYYDR